MKTMVGKFKPLSKKEFEALFESYELYLYKAAYAYLGTKDEALDALQETAYKAYKNRNRIKNTSNLKAWLLTILINYCRDYAKKRKKVVYLSENKINKHENCSSQFEESISDNILVHNALRSLSSPYREVVILKYFDDLTIKEISIILKRSESTVKTWLYKALKDLKIKIDSEVFKNA